MKVKDLTAKKVNDGILLLCKFLLTNKNTERQLIDSLLRTMTSQFNTFFKQKGYTIDLVRLFTSGGQVQFNLRQDVDVEHFSKNELPNLLHEFYDTYGTQFANLNFDGICGVTKITCHFPLNHKLNANGKTVCVSSEKGNKVILKGLENLTCEKLDFYDVKTKRIYGSVGEFYKVKGLETLFLDQNSKRLNPWISIVERAIKNKMPLSDFQNEMIKAGYKDYL